MGDWVLAIGSPFGLQATVTAGIISAKDRGVGRQFQHFLQTDAAINPGNSGGPLVDMAGQVIGINTAILTGGRGYEGVGFAMPSNTAIGVYNQIVEHGKVTRGSIGVIFDEEQSRNPIVLRDLGASYGVVLQSVEPGGPAARAGIKAGRRGHGGQREAGEIGSGYGEPDCRDAHRRARCGSVTCATANRAKLPSRWTIATGFSPDRWPATACRATPQRRPECCAAGGSGPARRGACSQPGAPPRHLRNERGVIVAEVAPTSFGEDLVFCAGDLITEINHVTIASVADYRKVVAAAEARATKWSSRFCAKTTARGC